jgi:hypothetical protein
MPTYANIFIVTQAKPLMLLHQEENMAKPSLTSNLSSHDQFIMRIYASS